MRGLVELLVLAGIAGMGWMLWRRCRRVEELEERVWVLTTENGRLSRLSSGQFAQMQATLGSLQEAVLMVDAENTVVLANGAMKKFFEGKGEVTGLKLEEVLPSVRFLDYVEAVRSGRAQAGEEMEFANAEKRIWAEVTGTVVEAPAEGQGVWALFVLHDVSRTKEVEALRKEFVASVSHELRTPLSVIKGYNETLLEDCGELPVEEQRKFLKTIQRHAERLNFIVEDLLTLSRLESKAPGTLERVPVMFGDFLRGFFEEFAARGGHEGHGVALGEIGENVEVWCDRARVTQVLENLLGNACKHTRAGTRVELSALVREKEVVVCVSDNGEGIAAVELPHLFERFYRVDKGRSRERGGTGLGLSIVKHIVQLHQGRVWVESEVGKGTRFWFSLPR